jgi:hypothetical protein
MLSRCLRIAAKALGVQAAPQCFAPLKGVKVLAMMASSSLACHTAGDRTRQKD